MKIRIQSATISDKNSPFHKKKKNIIIQTGRIVDITDKNISADKVIDADGMILSAGWIDLGTYAGDPGYEHKEDLASVVKAAAAGGFTEIVLLPNTTPSVQTKNGVSYALRGNETRLVQIHSMASVTRDNLGEELTEMIDLHTAGAIAFTDGLKTVWHTDILVKSLQYLQKFDGLLVNHPEDIWLSKFGQMHEGPNGTRLGLKGIPRLAEEVSLGRDLELLGYAGGRLHFSKLSSGKSVDLIRAAKKKGLNVTCDITSYQPLLDDGLLFEFDTNYKVNPPLREKEDNDALIKGLKDGTIDIICSGHLPQDEESKMLEFDLAEFGMINLQTFAAQVASLSRSVGLDDLIEKVTANPRQLLHLEQPVIDVDAKANLTLFDPNADWKFDAGVNLSRSKNSPWLGHELKGKAVAVFNNSKQLVDA
jgi:dihydroorotase